QTLPADSHDDDSGNARRRPAHAQHKNKLRDTRAARLRHRRRLGVEPIPDALYHSRRLPLSRSFDPAAAAPALVRQTEPSVRASPGGVIPVCTKNSDSDVVVMQSTEESM